MVTFRLAEQSEGYIVFWYFPNGKEENGHGIITIDRETGDVEITELAPDDFSHEVTVEEQNEMRNSVNEMRKKEGLAELTEEEWPLAEESYMKTFFADHAISKIYASYKKGVVLEKGMSAWY